MSRYARLTQKIEQLRQSRREQDQQEPGWADKQAAEDLRQQRLWEPLQHPGEPSFWRPRERLYLMDAQGETWQQRQLRMLRPLRKTCFGCTMCSLGSRFATRPGDQLELDPHCFSNLNPSRFMVVGQNPGWEELKQGEPFVGPSGANFDQELKLGGLSRTDFYICNAVRCATDQNQRPTAQQQARCTPFLQMELQLIRPLLVVALGSAAFASLCPGGQFSQALGQITRSGPYDVPVYAVYHPSPLNLQDPERASGFQQQMRLLCKLVMRLKQEAGLS